MNTLTRRTFFATTARYGLKAGAFAAAGVAATGTMPSIAAFLARDARAADKAKHKLRFGASTLNANNEKHLQTAAYDFAKKVEELSDGEIHMQVLDSAQGCAEPTCAERVIGGVFDIGATSAQNMASVVHYSQALDWPFLWRDRATFFNVFHDSAMNPVYRDVFRKRYGLELLYSGCEFRDIFMGLKYSNREEMRRPEEMAGAKVRITNSTMIKNFAQSLDLNPIPLAWVETLEGMKSGVVDAMETWPSAASGFGMTKVSAQWVRLSFCPGNELFYMSARSMDKLPERLQDVVRESARHASQVSFEKVAWAQNAVVGNGDDPGPESDFVQLKEQMKQVRLTDDELQAFRTRGAIENNPEIYSEVRKELDRIAGLDVFGALKEYEQKNRGSTFDPRKWWA